MTVTLTEAADSGSATLGPTGAKELKYIMEGTSDHATAEASAAANVPATYGLLNLESIQVDPVSTDTTAGTGTWSVAAKYGPKPPPGGVALQMETSGGTQHITQAISHVHSYGTGAPDMQGAIGVSGSIGDQKVEGVDIVVPVLNFTVTKIWPAESLPDPAVIWGLTGKVNSDSFAVTDSTTGLAITLAAGECLFNGAHLGGQRSDGGIEASYSFSGSPNRTGLTVGGITGIAKKGWEYMWVAYLPDATTGRLKPVAVYIEKVYNDGAFSALNLAPAEE